MSTALGEPAQRSRTRSLPKEARVAKRRDFLRIQSAGRRVPTRHFLLVYLRRGNAPARLGITVTKKLGNAVLRNRVKRAVREAFRARRATIAPGTSVVVIARDGAGKLSARDTAAELAPAFAALTAGDAPPSPAGDAAAR